MTTAPNPRLQGACRHTVVDVKGWPLEITLDELIDFVASEIGKRTLRLRINQLIFEDVAQSPRGPSGDWPMLPSRDTRVLAICPDGRATEMSLGDLIDFVVEEVKAALLEEGFISQADIDAREERLREVARIGGRETIRIVS